MSVDHKSISTAVSYSSKNLILTRFLELLSLSSGIVLMVWAFSDPQFRHTEGFLNGRFCLPLSISLGLITFGWALASRWKQSALWFVLALVGQSVALQLIDAGPLIHYQHYKSFDRLLTDVHPLLLIYV